MGFRFIIARFCFCEIIYSSLWSKKNLKKLKYRSKKTFLQNNEFLQRIGIFTILRFLSKTKFYKKKIFKFFFCFKRFLFCNKFFFAKEDPLICHIKLFCLEFIINIFAFRTSDLPAKKCDFFFVWLLLTNNMCVYIVISQKKNIFGM